MKFRRKKIANLWQYEITDVLCKQLFKASKEVTKNTFPKPGKVGAAVLTKKGNIYTGVSYHSDVYTLTMHAEMTSLAHAAIHGEKEVIAVTGPNCHICKQLLWESALRSKIDPIVIFKEKSTIKKIPLSMMMIYPWPEKP